MRNLSYLSHNGIWLREKEAMDFEAEKTEIALEVFGSVKRKHQQRKLIQMMKWSWLSK